MSGSELYCLTHVGIFTNLWIFFTNLDDFFNKPILTYDFFAILNINSNLKPFRRVAVRWLLYGLKGFEIKVIIFT